MNRLFKETPIFTSKLEEHGVKSLLKDIQDLILEDPEVGAIISGTGGLRKMRVQDQKRNKGKRGGIRIIYLDLPHKEITYLIYLYGKDETEDLTSAEKKAFKELVERLKGETDEKVSKEKRK